MRSPYGRPDRRTPRSPRRSRKAFERVARRPITAPGHRADAISPRRVGQTSGLGRPLFGALARLALADQFDVVAVGVEEIDRLAGDVRLDALVRDADGGQVLAPFAERADI